MEEDKSLERCCCRGVASAASSRCDSRQGTNPIDNIGPLAPLVDAASPQARGTPHNLKRMSPPPSRGNPTEVGNHDSELQRPFFPLNRILIPSHPPPLLSPTENDVAARGVQAGPRGQQRGVAHAHQPLPARGQGARDAQPQIKSTNCHGFLRTRLKLPRANQHTHINTSPGNTNTLSSPPQNANAKQSSVPLRECLADVLAHTDHTEQPEVDPGDIERVYDSLAKSERIVGGYTKFSVNTVGLCTFTS